MGKAPVNLTDAAYFKKVAEKQVDIGRKAAFLINTGNMVSNTGLDLMQASGFTVVADKINYMRFMSHFRRWGWRVCFVVSPPECRLFACVTLSVHRGQFFTTMKTTTVRKLLPESWGFICPVHTPDGGPCGLLNHLALNAGVVTHPSRGAEGMPPVLCRLGMTPLSGTAGTIPYNSLPVMLDGKVVGSVPPAVAPKFVAALRKLKTRTSPALSDQTQPAITAFIASVATTRDTGDVCMEDGEPNVLPTSLEVAYLPQPPQPATSEDGSATQSRLCGPFPGVFLSTAAARLIRPIRSIATGALEVIGPLEQVYMEIAATGEDVIDILGISEAEASSPSLKVPYTHVEVSPLAMLSVEAQLTPFSDCNQSPRNMYQCQMGKQTMGTPLHSFPHRADNKVASTS
jgi:DNA-directed RNA polymerase I subunit RPA2